MSKQIHHLPTLASLTFALISRMISSVACRGRGLGERARVSDSPRQPWQLFAQLLPSGRPGLVRYSVVRVELYFALN